MFRRAIFKNNCRETVRSFILAAVVVGAVPAALLAQQVGSGDSPSSQAAVGLPASSGQITSAVSASAFEPIADPVSARSGVSGQSVSRLPSVAPVSANRVNELEQRLTEIEALLEKQSKEREKEAAEKGYDVGSDLNMSAKWNNGIELQSKNKDFKIHVGGRTQIDTENFSGTGNLENPIADGGVGPLFDGTNMRRGRLRVEGTMYEIMDFACEYDFVNEVNTNPVLLLEPPQNSPSAVPSTTDLWIQINELPYVGHVKAGIFKDPYGFEHNTSSRYLNFMERSYNQDAFEGAFNNGFEPGVMIWNNALEDDRMYWAVGQFRNTNNIFSNGVGDGENEQAGRLTYLPVWKDDGRYLVHVGASGTHKALDEDQIRFRSRANVRGGAPSAFNPVLANTGNFVGDDEWQIGAEFVSVWGPWTLDAEYFGSWVAGAKTLLDAANPANAASGQQPQPPGTRVGTYYANGSYIEILYFLTGEHRAYNRKAANFERVVPYENFFWTKTRDGGCCAGLGAWQVGFRYSHLDLDSQRINGGTLNGYTVGLNWFLNPNTKVQWNYDLTQRNFTNIQGDNGNGNLSSYGMRLAFDF